MPQRVGAIRSVSKAYKVIKEISSQRLPWGEGYRFYPTIAPRRFLEGSMKVNRDSYLEEMAVRGGEDRRNGRYSRHLLAELGDVELDVPRTSRYSMLKVVQAYSRRSKRIGPGWSYRVLCWGTPPGRWLRDGMTLSGQGLAIMLWTGVD